MRKETSNVQSEYRAQLYQGESIPVSWDIEQQRRQDILEFEADLSTQTTLRLKNLPSVMQDLLQTKAFAGTLFTLGETPQDVTAIRLHPLALGSERHVVGITYRSQKGKESRLVAHISRDNHSSAISQQFVADAASLQEAAAAVDTLNSRLFYRSRLQIVEPLASGKTEQGYPFFLQPHVSGDPLYRDYFDTGRDAGYFFHTLHTDIPSAEEDLQYQIALLSGYAYLHAATGKVPERLILDDGSHLVQHRSNDRTIIVTSFSGKLQTISREAWGRHMKGVTPPPQLDWDAGKIRMWQEHPDPQYFGSIPENTIVAARKQLP